MRPRRLLPIACLIAAGASLAACSSASSSASTSTSGSSATQSVSVTVSASSASLPIYVAQQEGYFSANHLKVTTVAGTSASATIPQLVNGQVQFTISGFANVAQAAQQGLPVEIVAASSVNQTTTDTHFGAFVVNASSGITSLQGASGKTFAVNDVSPAGTFLDQAAFEAYGVTNPHPQYLEIAPQLVVSAVDKGTANVALLYQPILGQALQGGHLRAIAYLDGKVLPGMIQTAVITSRSYATQHPTAARAFASALNSACSFISSHPAQAAQILGNVLHRPMTASALAECPTAPLTVSGVQSGINVLLRYHVIDKNLSAAHFVLAGTRQ